MTTLVDLTPLDEPLVHGDLLQHRLNERYYVVILGPGKDWHVEDDERLRQTKLEIKQGKTWNIFMMIDEGFRSNMCEEAIRLDFQKVLLEEK